jgi:hypothetical protein
MLTKCQGVRDATQEPHLLERGQLRKLETTQAWRLPKKSISQVEPFGCDFRVSLVIMCEFTIDW